MRVGDGNKVIGLGFTGVRKQTSMTYGIVHISGNAEIRDCEFWDNEKVLTPNVQY